MHSEKFSTTNYRYGSYRFLFFPNVLLFLEKQDEYMKYYAAFNAQTHLYDYNLCQKTISIRAHQLRASTVSKTYPYRIDIFTLFIRISSTMS